MTVKPELPATVPETTWARLWFSVLRLLGWSVRGVRPPERKFIVCVAPHTSNWDWILLVFASRALNLPSPVFVAKHSIFRGPLGPIMRKLGGIPLDRERSRNFVDQIVAEYARRDELVIGITPEGTRSKTKYWRSGFYNIAMGAGVPITLGYLDYGQREIGMSAPFYPTGDIEADFVRIRAFYAGIQPRFPDLYGEPALRPAAANAVNKTVEANAEAASAEADQAP
ncbi:MAG: lysophospholipid acyltransferase family protein [Caldilineaceae bacterium]